MDDVVYFATTVVVGQDRGRHFGREYLNRWAKEQWGDFLPRLNLTKVLANGWFSFIFESSQLVDQVLNFQWSMDGVPLFLKHWDSLFDAKKEKVAMEPIWVQLHGSPMHLWTPA